MEESNADRSALFNTNENFPFSFILESDKYLAFNLLKYLKHYSELLFCLGEHLQAIQVCKVMAKAETHMEKLKKCKEEMVFGQF